MFSKIMAAEATAFWNANIIMAQNYQKATEWYHSDH